MAIINGVEQEFNEKKITKNFQNALSTACQRRAQQVQHDEIVQKKFVNSKGKKDQRVVMPNTYATAFAKDYINSKS